MDRLFRAMRNPERARGPGAMDPTSTSVDGLETVETRHYKISKAPPARHRCAGRCANGGQLRWTVAPRKHSSAKTRSVERLLRLARTSRAHGSWLGQPAEPPDADPHVRSCGRGGRATVSPIPITKRCQVIRAARATSSFAPDGVRRALRQFPNGAIRRRNTYGIGHPILRCPREFLFSAR